MRPGVATVLSSRPWETEFVDLARRSARVRVVGRAYEPEDLHRMGTIGSVVVGSETAWLSPAVIRAWRGRGWRVLGLHPADDAPGRHLLEQGGADLVAPDSTRPELLIRTIATWSTVPIESVGGATFTTVTGARGAPGRTTVAVALARVCGPGTLLLDADPLPNLGPALGLGPGPDLSDLMGGLRSDSGFVGLAHTGDGLAVLCPESGGHPLAGALLCELAMGARAGFAHIILETGPPSPDLGRMLRAADRSILVVDGTLQGVIRAGHLVRDWPVEAPFVVVNRVQGDPEALRRSVRSALGIEPDVLLPRFTGDPIESSSPFIAGLVGLDQEPDTYSSAAT